VILFPNGLSLVVMELKSPSRENAGIENAYRLYRHAGVR
jgi:type I site-specific restriction-modification system R (restriction) subunit